MGPCIETSGWIVVCENIALTKSMGKKPDAAYLWMLRKPLTQQTYMISNNWFELCNKKMLQSLTVTELMDGEKIRNIAKNGNYWCFASDTGLVLFQYTSHWPHYWLGNFNQHTCRKIC